MIKKIIRNLYKNDIESDEDFEAFYYLRHISLRLEFFLNLRIIVYYTVTLVATSLILCAVIPQDLTTIYKLILVLIFGIICGYSYCVTIDKHSEKLISNTKKAKDFLLNFFTLYRNDVISYADWKKIKSVDKALYSKLTSDKSLHLCYHYSLQLGLFLKDVELVWCGIYCPFNKCYFAHAFILKNGYVYDSNHRISHKLEDYAKAMRLKLYKTWSYKEYSIPYFRSTVRNDFRKWCKENDITGYRYF